MGLYYPKCALSGIALMGMQVDVILLAGSESEWTSVSLPVRAETDGYGGIENAEGTPTAESLLRGAVACLQNGKLKIDWEALGESQSLPKGVEELVYLVGRSEAEPRRAIWLADGRALSYAFVCSTIWDLVSSGAAVDPTTRHETSWHEDSVVPFYSLGRTSDTTCSESYSRMVARFDDLQRRIPGPWAPTEARQYSSAQMLGFVQAARRQFEPYPEAVNYLSDLAEQIADEM